MVDTGFSPSASEAGNEAVSLRVAPMSRAERLHRWADSLKLQSQVQAEAEALGHGGPRSTTAESTALRVAFEDWAFQAEGLRDEGLASACAYFELSESEMERIFGAGRGSRTIPVAVVAERVRALARQAEGRATPEVDQTVAAHRVIPTVRRSGWVSAAGGYRRGNAALSRGDRVGREVRRAGRGT